MAMYSLLRLALLVYNREQIGGATAAVLAEAFFNGLRFDLRLVVIACLPMLLAMPSPRAMSARGFFRLWLTIFASVTLFLGVIELDFYREFNQRLNALVFQYLKEDPETVLNMIWYGFPVVRYLLAWALASSLLAWLFRKIDPARSNRQWPAALGQTASAPAPRAAHRATRGSAAGRGWLGLITYLMHLKCLNRL